jgi:uncharacterized integral membrane protein
MDQRIQKVSTRLMISTIVFFIFMTLSTVAFYYLHTEAPMVPLIVGLMGAPAATIMLMSLHDLRLLKRKKSQQLG